MVPEPEKTGVTLPYEKIAMAGGEMPDGLEYPDQILFLELRMLYDQFKRGIVDKATATREKKRLLDNYRIYQFNEQMGKEWAQIIKQIDLFASEYRKNPSIKAADELLKAIYRTERKTQ